MGGDDLGSDDEYLSAPIKGEQSAENSEENDSDSSDDEYSMDGGPSNTLIDEVDNTISNSRKRGNDDVVTTPTESASTKRKKNMKELRRGENGGQLKTLGIGIRHESIESKAEILSQYATVKFLPQHISKIQNNHNNNNHRAATATATTTATMDSSNFMDRLLCLISKKQLKKTMKGSPRVIVLCLSARRCVSVLKNLVPLKLRIAKLFPKQGNIEEQANQLQNTDFGLAVGTPHRIKVLMDRGSLSLKNTQLFGLDTFENEKRFTVYTLPDTSCHTQELLKNHVHQELSTTASTMTHKGGKKGGELKVGFI